MTLPALYLPYSYRKSPILTSSIRKPTGESLPVPLYEAALASPTGRTVHADEPYLNEKMINELTTRHTSMSGTTKRGRVPPNANHRQVRKRS